ncbi:MAG: HD-GYP domain-containing protein [Kordiimonas sp.]
MNEMQNIRIGVDGLARFGLSMLKLSDPYTSGHCRKVQEWSVEMARAIKLPEASVKAVSGGAALHDIGKQGIPSSVLSKPGRLTFEEYELVKTHVQKGVNLLVEAGAPAQIIRIVAEHHERLDGSGYPNGLYEEEISLEGQIVALADTLGALTTKRTYHIPVTIEEAVLKLRHERKRLFAPRLLELAETVLCKRRQKSKESVSG